MTQQIEQKQA